MSKLDQNQYQQFVLDIKEKIKAAQYEALKKVNKRLIKLYWDIGEKIVEKQQTLGWGKSVVNILATDLQKDMPGAKGFSATNLWRMRYFYMAYPNFSNLPPLVGEIGWTHNIFLYKD